MGISDDFYQDFIGVQDSQCEMMMLARFGSAINLALFKSDRDTYFHQSREKGIAYKPGFDKLFQSLNANALRCALVISSSLVDVSLSA